MVPTPVFFQWASSLSSMLQISLSVIMIEKIGDFDTVCVIVLQFTKNKSRLYSWL